MKPSSESCTPRSCHKLTMTTTTKEGSLYDTPVENRCVVCHHECDVWSVQSDEGRPLGTVVGICRDCVAKSSTSRCVLCQHKCRLLTLLDAKNRQVVSLEGQLRQCRREHAQEKTRKTLGMEFLVCAAVWVGVVLGILILLAHELTRGSSIMTLWAAFVGGMVFAWMASLHWSLLTMG